MGYMILNAVKSAESAKKILEKRNDLTDEQKAYLSHVIKEGKDAEPRAKAFRHEKRKERARRRRGVGEEDKGDHLFSL